MNVNTIIGALLAALLIFITSLTALFMENPDLTFGAIRQSAWVSIIGGAVAAFIKDYQAISTRRLVNKVTKTGDGGGTI